MNDNTFRKLKRAAAEKRRYRNKRRRRQDQDVPENSDDSHGNPNSSDSDEPPSEASNESSNESSAGDGSNDGSLIQAEGKENSQSDREDADVAADNNQPYQEENFAFNAEPEDEDSNHHDDNGLNQNAETNGSDSDVPDQEDGSENSDSGQDSESGASDMDEENDGLGEEMDHTPIYNDAEITVRESLLSILTYSLTHQLTGAAINDLLTLIGLHCKQNNFCIQTLYKFKKYFSMTGNSIIKRHFYCSVCEVPLLQENARCNTCLGRNPVAFFIEFPIETQLQSMFLRPGFYEALAFRFNRIKKHADNIEDIYDSEQYKQLMANGFLQNPNNLSFFMYFDGVALFKSSKFSIWPVYLTLNELNYKQMTQKENVVLASLWFGKKKPNPNLFLKPLQEKLSSLENVGVELKLPANRATVRVRCKLLGAVADMPAKSTFMRFKQYNSNYSCFSCIEQGAKYFLPNGPGVQVFPYTRNFVLRNNNDVIEFAQQALIDRRTDPKASIHGIKGPSYLHIMLPDMINCMGSDIMHGVFLGVMKHLCGYWFDSQHHGSVFCVSTLVDVVDERLKQIKTPSIFQRIPRSIESDLALYKASDFKNFFFHFSLPVLLGVLPQEHWNHHAKLVSAIAILCQDSISHQQIDEAEELIHSYVSDFQALYSLRYMSLTIHQLLHLPMIVRNLGNLWIYSCFFYESLNGQISKLVHGTRHAALQICSTSSVFLNLPFMIDEMNDGRKAKDFCSNLRNEKKPSLKILERIDDVTFAVGTYQPGHPVPPYLYQALRESFNINGGQLKFFYRLKRKGALYTSEMYTRCKQKNSSYVEILHEGAPYLCEILYYVKWYLCNRECPDDCDVCPKRFFCVTTSYERQPWEIHLEVDGVNLSYLHKVTPSENIRVYSVEEIRSLCVYMNIDESEYFSSPVNSLEVE